MRKAVAVFLCACSLAACRPREPVTGSASRKVVTTVIPENEARKKERDLIRPRAPIEKALLGAQLGPDGAVSHETDHFETGQTVYLTLRLGDSPVGLKTNAIWYGPGQKMISSERREMNGAKVATFALTANLPPGRYRVEGHWGGNLAADKTFEVALASKKKKS
ncbi:MAG TPA: hypothetical protein VGA84_05535 [Thermoanaerobaculia bacterium]